MAKYFETCETSAEVTLFAGPQAESVATQEIILADGIAVERGTVLQRVAGVCSPITAANQQVWAIASEPVEDDESRVTVGYTKGGFNRAALKFGPPDGESPQVTWADIEASARGVGIRLYPVVPAVGD